MDVEKNIMKNHYQYLTLIVVMFLGFLYKKELLDFPRDFWHDEAFQFLYAEKPISFIISSMDVHPPLFNLLSKGIIFLSDSISGTRYFIVLFSLIMIVTTYFYVSKVFGKWEGVIACAIMSTFPTWVFYATEFRSYMFVMMILPLQMYFFYQYYSKEQDKDMYICMLISVLLLYTHYFTGLVFLGQAIFFIVRGRVKSFKELQAILIAGILCIPLILYFLNTLPKIQGFWFKEINLQSLVSTFSYLIFPETSGYKVIFLLLFYTIFIFIFFKVFFEGKFEDKHLLLIYQGLLPIIIMFVVSQVHPIYHHRYFLFGGMSILILFAVSVTRFSNTLKTNDNKSLFLLIIALLVFSGGFMQSSDDFDFELRDSATFLKNVIETDIFYNEYIIVHTSTFSQSPYKVYLKDNYNVQNILLTTLTEKQLFTAGGSVINDGEIIRDISELSNVTGTIYFVSDKPLKEKVIWEEGGLYITRDKNFAEKWDEEWN